MVALRFLFLLQFCAVAAVSSLLLAASRGPVDAALPPPMMSGDASATTDVPRTVEDGRGVAASVARRLGTPHGLRRRLSDIPAAAPPAADDYDISADAPDADYGYDIPADGTEWWTDAAEDYYDVAPADAPAAAAPSSGDDGDVGAGADKFPSTVLDFALMAVLFVLAVIGGSVVISFLVVGLLNCAASLPSFVAGLYAAAKTAREKATRVRPLDD